MHRDIDLSEVAAARIYKNGKVEIIAQAMRTTLTHDEMKELVASWLEIHKDKLSCALYAAYGAINDD